MNVMGFSFTLHQTGIDYQMIRLLVQWVLSVFNTLIKYLIVSKKTLHEASPHTYRSVSQCSFMCRPMLHEALFSLTSFTFRQKVFPLFCIYMICNANKIFTFGEIIFLIERCIVKKKTYLCRVQSEKWLDDKKAFFALSLYRNRQFLAKG